MTKKEKVGFVLQKLEELYPAPAIPLKYSDPYTLLISVILSAQCTDKRVNQVTPLLFAKAKSAAEMVKLSAEQIEEIIRPCGLSNNKSKAIHGLSGDLIQRFNGKVPDELSALESLPGVGHKTASVVMVQAFGKSAFPVDTHIHRLLYRWGISNGKNVVQTERDAKALFPRSTWPVLHLQLIYYGREHCPARGHKMDNCPICSEIGVKSRM